MTKTKPKLAAVPKPAEPPVAPLAPPAPPAPESNDNPAPPQQFNPPPMPQLKHVLMVIFNYVTKDGQTGTDRVYLEGANDIIFRTQIELYENAILQRSEGQLIKVMITDWKRLDG